MSLTVGGGAVNQAAEQTSPACLFLFRGIRDKSKVIKSWNYLERVMYMFLHANQEPARFQSGTEDCFVSFLVSCRGKTNPHLRMFGFHN